MTVYAIADEYDGDNLVGHVSQFKVFETSSNERGKCLIEMEFSCLIPLLVYLLFIVKSSVIFTTNVALSYICLSNLVYLESILAVMDTN